MAANHPAQEGLRVAIIGTGAVALGAACLLREAGHRPVLWSASGSGAPQLAQWQHVCYNLKHPVFGTGVETPLGKREPGRAAEAAAFIRQAISHAMPRDQIVKEIAGGYGHAGTVPVAWSAPEYDHAVLKPIAYDLDLARSFMEQAGYVY